jgi:hypothetical protein
MTMNILLVVVVFILTMVLLLVMSRHRCREPYTYIHASVPAVAIDEELELPSAQMSAR